MKLAILKTYPVKQSGTIPDIPDTEITQMKEQIRFYILHYHETKSNAYQKIISSWAERLTSYFANLFPTEEEVYSEKTDDQESVYLRTTNPARNAARDFVEARIQSIIRSFYRDELPRWPRFSSTERINQKF